MHPAVRRLVDRAIDLVLAAGKVVMYPAATGAEARAMSQRGVRLITMNFGALARRAVAEYLEALRGPESPR
jgi:2-keto-3-deoxy-L-rhamnonate aldolase RhmA